VNVTILFSSHAGFLLKMHQIQFRLTGFGEKEGKGERGERRKGGGWLEEGEICFMKPRRPG